MSLEERLVQEMKEAMKSNDKLRLSTIRMIRSAVKNKEIELRKPLDDGEIQKVIQGMVRKGEESVEQFKLGGRMDLVEKESKEIEILKSFLPQSLTQEEILKIIDANDRRNPIHVPKRLREIDEICHAKITGESRWKAGQPARQREAFPVIPPRCIHSFPFLSSLLMDDRSLKVLEFYQLLEIMKGFCISPLGRKRCEVLRPSRDLSWIQTRSDRSP